jgi:hypothetical protein
MLMKGCLDGLENTSLDGSGMSLHAKPCGMPMVPGWACRYEPVRNYFREQEAKKPRAPKKPKLTKMKGAVLKKAKSGL